MKKIGKTLIPRLPRVAREKLKSGGTHKNKKAYKRADKHKKNTADEPPRPQFFTNRLDILEIWNSYTKERAVLDPHQNLT